MKHLTLALLLGLLMCLQGCMATVGASKVSIPPDAQQQCAAHCSHIGMTLGAVAIMAENVGCVCQPKGTTASTGPSAGITGGMATIAMQNAQRQQQNQQQNRPR